MKQTKELIMIVEDDRQIQDFIAYSLMTAGFGVLTAGGVEEAMRKMRSKKPDIMVLDLGLPDGDGLDLIRRVRKFSDIPIIVVSARDKEEDKIEALDRGAEDYITKPFRPLVLGAKVKALIRRNKNLVLDNSDTLECGPFSYDTTTMRFYKNGEELILSSKESALLLLFMKHPQQVFTKDMIYEHVWGNTVAVDDNAIMVYINRLRGKIEDDRQNPAYILKIRGLGYRFVP